MNLNVTLWQCPPNKAYRETTGTLHWAPGIAQRSHAWAGRWSLEAPSPDLRTSQAVFNASAFFCSDGVPPAPPGFDLIPLLILGSWHPIILKERLAQLSQFRKWAQEEHSLARRIIALLPAGVLFLIILPYLFLIICPSLDERLGLDRIEPGAATIIIGLILMVLGFFFAFWSIMVQLTQGRGTPLPMMPTQGLIATGPFRYCRNPRTLGTILAYLGMTIAAATVVGVAFVLAFGSLLITYLKKVEEFDPFGNRIELMEREA